MTHSASPALMPPPLQPERPAYVEMELPYMDGPSKEVLDLALVAIDGMAGLPEESRADEEEQVRALLSDLETDEKRTGELEQWLQKAAGTGQMRYEVLARLMGVPQVMETEGAISATEVTRRLESDHYAKEAPKFADQLTDESREEVRFEYDEQTFSDAPKDRGRNRYQTTELKGLRQLSGFVSDFIRKSAGRLNMAGFGVARNTAKSIKENLTYIGGKELDEGGGGISQYLNEYLTQDQANQLCIITDSSMSDRQRRERSMVKSDDFIKDKVLDAMTKAGVSDEVLSRIVTDPTKITADPENVKIVFLDDWVVSGRQMRKKIQTVLPSIEKKYHQSIEVDVITAPQHFVKDGLDMDDTTGRSVPVMAYYRAHKAAAADSEGVEAHITGTHSTVNFGFSVQIERMQRLTNETRGPGQRRISMPAAASVYRQYWN